MGEKTLSVQKIKKKSSRKITTSDMVVIALSTAIIAVCSWISVPTAVPFTLQTFAVFTIAGLFGAKCGTLSVLVYILLGAVGAPVFAQFTSGINILLGSTGGYIIGFTFITLIVGFAADKFNHKPIWLAVSMIFGLIVCYAFGSAWFMFVYAHSTGAVGLGTVLSWCVIPFIIPDCIKIACAVIISKRVGKYVKF